MTAKHTPGPWSVEDEMDNGDIAICNKSNSEIIAFVCGDDKKAKLDARLIAAAPDLLSALTELMASAGENITRESDKSLAAILDEPDCPDEAKRQIRAFLIARAAIAKATGDAP